MIANLLLFLPLIAAAPASPTPSSAVEPVVVMQQAGSAGMHMAKTTVGMRVSFRDFLLKGSRLRATPVLDPGKADAVVRILNVAEHGTDHRYDFEIMPFVAGVLDVRALFEREDGSSTEDLPSMTLLVEEVLAPGRIQPNELQDKDPGRFGGYWNQMIFAWIAWGVGLLLIVVIGWKRKQRLALAETQGGPSLAKRLEPLVQSAQRGDLSDADRAGLERLLFAYWREKRGLESTNVAAAMSEVRGDAEAGPLLQQLESWLHDPHAKDSDVDVRALLEPYENAPDEDYATPGARA